MFRKGRPGRRGQALEVAYELVGPGRAEASRTRLEVLQHLVDLPDSSSGLHFAPPFDHLVHQTDVSQRGTTVTVRGRCLHKVSARLGDPFTGPSLLFLRQVTV